MLNLESAAFGLRLYSLIDRRDRHDDHQRGKGERRFQVRFDLSLKAFGNGGQFITAGREVWNREIPAGVAPGGAGSAIQAGQSDSDVRDDGAELIDDPSPQGRILRKGRKAQKQKD